MGAHMDTPNDIAMLVNPRSGKGKGRRVAEQITRALDNGSREIIHIEIDALEELDNLKAEALRALIVVGGDGTVHAALGSLVRSRIPVYHAPLGTENLFSREFGMSRDPARVKRVIDSGTIRTVDLARCEGVYFAIMCGLGFDASVIESLHEVRTGSISHLSYIPPILRELRTLRNVPLRLEVDGQIVVDGGIGQLVIANSRQYALRNDPAINASMTDGLTDAVFLPCRTRVGLLAWSARTRFRRHLGHPRTVYATGREMSVTALGDRASVQIDGEFLRALKTGESIEITTHPGALRVLCEGSGPVGG